MDAGAARFTETVPNNRKDCSRSRAHTAAVIPEIENLPGPANRRYVQPGWRRRPRPLLVNVDGCASANAGAQICCGLVELMRISSTNYPC